MRQEQQRPTGVASVDDAPDTAANRQAHPSDPASLRPKGSFSPTNFSTFASFSSPAYRVFYGGMMGQMAAMNMQMVTSSLLAYRLTGSTAILGLTSLANAVPMILLSLYGGVVADRVQKKFMLLGGQLAFALASLIVAVGLLTGYVSAEHGGSWWVLIVSSVLQGGVSGLVMPSRQAIIPELVGEKHLMNAIALNSLGMNTLRLLAPAAGGFLIDVVGFAAVYLCMTGLYVFAALFAALLPRTSPAGARASGLAALKEGLRYVQEEKTVLLVLAVTFLVVLLSMPIMTLLPAFTEGVLHVGASGMGILLSVSGAGAMVGSLVLASISNKKRGLLLMAGTGVLAIALVGFSFSRWWTASLVFMVFVGLGQTVRQTLGSSLLQSYTEQTYRGRVMSLMMMEFGLSSFGAFATAIVAEAIGVQWAVGGLAIILAVLCVVIVALSPRLRRLD